MAQCRYIIATSVNESFGRIPLEANLLKIPILASNSGGHKETIINNVTGHLIEYYSPNEFAKKIIFLENNPNFKLSIINNGYKHALKFFSLEQHVKKIKDIYEK